MWKAVVSYLPDWKVLMQGVIVFLVPFGISRLFNLIRTSKDDSQICKGENQKSNH
jgi:hypothetical protein